MIHKPTIYILIKTPANELSTLKIYVYQRPVAHLLVRSRKSSLPSITTCRKEKILEERLLEVKKVSSRGGEALLCNMSRYNDSIYWMSRVGSHNILPLSPPSPSGPSLFGECSEGVSFRYILIRIKMIPYLRYLDLL